MKTAASLIVCSKFNTKFKILLLKRSSRGNFGNLVVFPGGVVDPADLDTNFQCILQSNLVDWSLRITALREAFEEAGLLILNPKRKVELDFVNEWRKKVHSDANMYILMARKLLSAPGIDQLVYWANWITPAVAKSRFNTHFYLTTVSESTSYSKSITQDNTETVQMYWYTPREALDKFRAGEIEMFPPQVCMLMELEGMMFENLQDMIENKKMPFVEPVCPEFVDGYTVLPGDYLHSSSSSSEKQAKKCNRIERNEGYLKLVSTGGTWRRVGINSML